MTSRVVIRFTAGTLAGQKFSLGPGDYRTIGSAAECDIRLTGNSEIAGRHACIFHAPGGKILFKDLGSMTGTYVDGKRLRRTLKIRPGQTVVLGKTEVFHSSWWNALQLSQVTQITRLTARKVQLTAARRALASPARQQQRGLWSALGLGLVRGSSFVRRF